LGYTLKQARQLKGLTQADVALKLNVHRQTYSKWEKKPGEMPVGKALHFSHLTGINLDSLFFISDSTFSREDDGPHASNTG
jgi:transcriptional regulator with XRE-family HTH domain